jgi:hypothetical protein
MIFISNYPLPDPKDPKYKNSKFVGLAERFKVIHFDKRNGFLVFVFVENENFYF